MTFNRTFFALTVAVGALLIGGCSSSQTESATNVPGPPSGPQPAAAGGSAGAAAGGARTENAVQ